MKSRWPCSRSPSGTYAAPKPAARIRCRRGRLGRRVERVHVDAGVLGRGSGHTQIEEPPTVGEKPRKEMRRLLSRRIRLRHDGRRAARRRTADDATLRASDHDDVVLVPRAADRPSWARCTRSVEHPRSRRPSSVARRRRTRRTDCPVTRTSAARMPPSATSVPGSGTSFARIQAANPETQNPVGAGTREDETTTVGRDGERRRLREPDPCRDLDLDRLTGDRRAPRVQEHQDDRGDTHARDEPQRRRAAQESRRPLTVLRRVRGPRFTIVQVLRLTDRGSQTHRARGRQPFLARCPRLSARWASRARRSPSAPLTALTGATNRYPRFGTVSTYLSPSGVSPSARRSANT